MSSLVCDRFDVHIAPIKHKANRGKVTIRYTELPELPFMVVDHRRGQVWQIEQVRASNGYWYGIMDNVEVNIELYEVVK